MDSRDKSSRKGAKKAGRISYPSTLCLFLCAFAPLREILRHSLSNWNFKLNHYPPDNMIDIAAQQ
jgi:hypothetical protein